MISKLFRQPITRQVSLVTTILIILAFAMIASVTYLESASVLKQNQFVAQQKEVKALAKTVGGRYDAAVHLVKTQFKSFRLNQLSDLHLTSKQQTIGQYQIPQALNHGVLLSQQTGMIDRFLQRYGSYVTVFIREHQQFIRVLSSLKDDGSDRLIGSRLDPTSSAYQHLIGGHDYDSQVKLYGHRYLGYYAPIHNRQGDMIGALFVGSPMQEIIHSIIDSLKTVHWGKTGYSIIVDANPSSHGIYLYNQHQNLIGTSILDLVLPGHIPNPFDQLFQKSSGLVTFPWKDNQGLVRPKYLAYAHVPGWNWVLMGGTFISELTQANRVLLMWTISVAVVAGIAIVVVLWFLMRQLLGPLHRLSQQVDAFGQGQISLAIDNVQDGSNNDVHRLAGSIAGMRHGLLSLVERLKTSCSRLGTVSEEIIAQTNTSRTQLDEVGEQTNQLATAVEEMSVSANSVAEQSESIASEVRHALSEGQTSGEQVLSMVSEMAQLEENLEQSVQAIHQVGEHSRGIEKVTSIIDAIAEQTNLLALNAAIEAARAGEQGRGFAVVADEVRQLAYRTQQSVKDVVNMINLLQKSTTGAVSIMEESQSMGEKVSHDATNVGGMLDKMNQQVHLIAEMTDSIAATAEQQSQVAQELASGITNVRDRCERNRDVAGQSVEYASQLSHESRALNREVEFFH